MKLSLNRRTIALAPLLLLSATPLAAYYGFGTDVVTKSAEIGVTPWKFLTTYETGSGYQLTFGYFTLIGIALAPITYWTWRNRDKSTPVPKWLWWAGGIGTVLLLPLGGLLGLTMMWIMYSISRKP
jgi:hypothetical protein